MTCKPYNELYREAKEYVTNEEEFKNLFNSVKEMDYAERADAYMENKLNVTDAINATKPWLDKQRVEIVDITKKGDKYNIAYKYLKSEKIYNKTVGEYRLSMGEEGKSFDVLVKALDNLYSDMDYVNEGRTGYEKTVVDMVNDSGKIVGLAEEIAGLDSIKAKNEKALLAKVKYLASHLAKQVPEVIVNINKQAKKNGGYIPASKDKVEMYMSIGPGNANRSALEVYAHELYHGITRYAVDSKDPALSNVMSKIKQIRLQFLDNTKAEDLAKYMNEKETAVEEAEKVLKYLADERVGIHEFIAYAMTNHAVTEILKSMKIEAKEEEHPDYAAKLASLVRKIVEAVTNIIKKPNKNANGYTDMVELVEALANANNRQLEYKRSAVLERVFSVLDKGDEKLAEYIKKMEDKAGNAPLPKKGSKGIISDAAYLMKLAAKSLVDDRAKRVGELTAGLAGLKPEGTIQTIIRDMSKGDAYQDLVERLGLMSQNIDQHREYTYTQTALAIKNGFKEALTAEESKGLTDVILDTDISSIWADYNVKEMLGNESRLVAEINKLDSELKSMVDVKDYRYYREQYRGLGMYMATGKASMIQLLNAQNIAEKLNHPTDRKREVDPKIVDIIDKLASMEALRQTSEGSKKVVANLIGKDSDGVANLVAYQSAHKTMSEEKLFDTDADRRRMIKGYSKEIYDGDIDMQVAPVADEGKMKSQGYKLVEVLSRHYHDANTVPMGMYVSTGKVVQNLHRVTMRYTDKGRRGTSIKDSYAIAGSEFASKKAKRDITKMNLDVAKKIIAIENGDKEALTKDDYGLAPILDNTGNVTDYRYMMTKDKKESVLKMDRRVVNIVGRMYASTYDKEKSTIFNDEIMKIINEDAKKNYIEKSNIGRNSKEYVMMEKNSSNAEIRDLWSVIPDAVKEQYPTGFPIRRDIMHSMLGYRELSVTDMPGIKHLPDSIKHGLRVAESIWKDVVKITKIDIVLKTPAVLIGNVISNFMYSVVSGEMPHKIAALQLQGVKELNEYLAKTKEIILLEGRIGAGRASEVEKRRVSALKNDLQTSSVKDLIDEGFYMSIIEELGLEEFSEHKGLQAKIDEKLSHLPMIVQKGLDWAYIGDKTSVFKALNMATQYSDFVARYAQYHLMVKKGIDKDVAIKTVRDAYINYNKPNSRFVEWANQMGLVMFTKYFTRVQRVIKTSAETHPLRMLLAILGQEMITGDIEDITNQSIFAKNLGTIVYSPLDVLIGATHPHGLEAVAAVVKGV